MASINKFDTAHGKLCLLTVHNNGNPLEVKRVFHVEH